MIRTDSHYVIGSTHFVCQDYARSGTYPLPYVLLSDGCSGSEDSDLGARCLVHAAENSLNYVSLISNRSEPEYSLEPLSLISRTRLLHKSWDSECLDGTLLSLVIKGNEYIFDCYGDGVLIKKYKNNSKLEVFQIEYTSNAPAYVNYLSSIRGNGYLEKFGGIKKHSKYEINNITSYSLQEEIYIFNSLKDRKELSETSWVDLPWYHESGLIQDLEYMVIASDGIFSCHPKGQDSNLDFTLLHVLPKLLDFKSFAGDFVKRRLQAFTKRDCPQNQMEHGDDISLGVIYFGENK